MMKEIRKGDTTAMSIQPLEIISPRSFTFAIGPNPGVFSILATGIAVFSFRGISDSEYLREDLIFTIPDSLGNNIAIQTNAGPDYKPVFIGSTTLAVPATVELDGPGVLGWGVDDAVTDPDYPPPNDGAFILLTLRARVVVRSVNTVILRMGYQVNTLFGHRRI
jgi:hypothetical protein